MRITIDSAGRIVISAAGSPSSLVKKNGVLVHHGNEKIELDVVDFIASQRSKRTLKWINTV